MGRNRKAHSSGGTKKNMFMLEASRTRCSMGRGLLNLLMDNFKDISKMGRRRDMGYSSGILEESMRESTKRIYGMDLESISAPKDSRSTKGSGVMINQPDRFFSNKKTREGVIDPQITIYLFSLFQSFCTLFIASSQLSIEPFLYCLN